MSSPGSAFGRSHGVLVSRLLWPAGILFAATLWIVFSTTLWTSDSVNAIALERQQVQLSAAIKQHLDDLRTRFLDFAAAAGRFDGLGDLRATRDPAAFEARAHAVRDFDSLLVVTPDWRLVAGSFEHGPVTAGRLLRVRQLADSVVAAALAFDIPPDGLAVSPDLVVTRLLSDGHEAYAAFAVPVELPAIVGDPVRRRVVLVAHTFIDSDALTRIASFHDLERLRVSRSKPQAPMAASPIRNAHGEIAAYMTWSPNRPGDLMREKLVPLTFGGFCVAVLLFGLLAGYLHWLATDLAKTETRSRDLLGRDPLSGLANRLLFGECLDRSLDRLERNGEGVAVLFIDLDRFKDVNDTHGHQAGDDLIQLVAQRLISLVRASDTIARFGGDEFAIIQTGVETLGGRRRKPWRDASWTP